MRSPLSSLNCKTSFAFPHAINTRYAGFDGRLLFNGPRTSPGAAPPLRSRCACHRLPPACANRHEGANAADVVRLDEIGDLAPFSAEDTPVIFINGARFRFVRLVTLSTRFVWWMNPVVLWRGKHLFRPG